MFVVCCVFEEVWKGIEEGSGAARMAKIASQNNGPKEHGNGYVNRWILGVFRVTESRAEHNSLIILFSLSSALLRRICAPSKAQKEHGNGYEHRWILDVFRGHRK